MTQSPSRRRRGGRERSGSAPPPLPEPATFTGIDGADVDLDVVEELPADVRVEVMRQMELWRATRRGVRL